MAKKIDPTKNVLDLVHAAMRRQDDMREAETRRINELAAQKLTFDNEMAKVLRQTVLDTAALLAVQLKEVKNDLSLRMSEMERFRWETGGKQHGFGTIGAVVLGIISGMSASIALAMLAFTIWKH